MRFSIVTPVYNAEKYLLEMIDSVRNQTFADWELRITDDGSTDGSADIIRRMAEEDERIKPIYLSGNSGSCFLPRRRAIEAAEGEYVVNIDADDRVDADYLSKLARRIEETGADIVYADMYLFNDELAPEKFLPKDPSLYGKTFEGKSAFTMGIDVWELSGVCATRRDLATRSLREFPEEMASETEWNSFDNENLTRLDLFHARAVAFCRASYFYRQIPQSVSHRVSRRKFGLLSSDLRLCAFTARKFGKGSEEYALTQRQLFHHVVEFLRILNGRPELRKDTGIRKLIKEAYASLDFKLLKGRVSWKYRLLLMSGIKATRLVLYVKR